MVGYSDTPLPKKLGIKPGFKIALPSIPPDVRKEIQTALANCKIARTRKSPVDLVLHFVTTQKSLIASFPTWASRLTPAGMLWIAWPKKSSGMPTDLDENEIRKVGLAAGLVDVKVCAINEIWSGLKFVRRLGDRVHPANVKVAAR
jgi:hypothetical protein